MIEIKFRAWNSEGKEFIYFSLMGEGTERDCFIADETDETGGYPTVDKQDVEVIQQFTGLYAKDETPIYEGDILEGYGEVVWIEQAASFRVNPSKNNTEASFTESFRNIDDLKVIGNIYENPNLLKQQ